MYKAFQESSWIVILQVAYGKKSYQCLDRPDIVPLGSAGPLM